MKRCVLFAIGLEVVALATSDGYAMGRDFRTQGQAVQEKRLEEALALLRTSPTGDRLLGAARKLWGLGPNESIRPFLTWGAASKTDAVLTRSFDPTTGEETRKREVRISLREDAPPSELLLDLAHELVHATTPPEWDPYDPELTASRYVWNALEGPGGEVEAVYFECMTAMELRSHFEKHAQGTWKRCQGYWQARSPASEGTNDLKQRILADFYRVGSYKPEIDEKLRGYGETSTALPHLSELSPRLFSSTGAAPYPLALLHEFGELNRVACQNSHRRLATAQSHPEGSPRESLLKRTLERFLKARCPKTD